MAKEGYIKDAFVYKHPLAERTSNELQIYYRYLHELSAKHFVIVDIVTKLSN